MRDDVMRENDLDAMAFVDAMIGHEKDIDEMAQKSSDYMMGIYARLLASGARREDAADRVVEILDEAIAAFHQVLDRHKNAGG